MTLEYHGAVDAGGELKEEKRKENDGNDQLVRAKIG